MGISDFLSGGQEGWKFRNSEWCLSILVLNGDVFVFGTIIKTKDTHWFQYTSQGNVPIRRWHQWLQAWPEMKVQFAQIFRTKTRNEWVMTSAMLAQKKAPRGSLVDTLQFQNDTTKIYKETCSKQSMAGCSWFVNSFIYSGGSFQSKNLSSLLFRCFLPAAGRGI